MNRVILYAYRLIFVLEFTRLTRSVELQESPQKQHPMSDVLALSRAQSKIVLCRPEPGCFSTRMQHRTPRSRKPQAERLSPFLVF